MRGFEPGMGRDDPSLRGLPLPSRVGSAPPSIESILLAAAGPPRFAERLATIERLTAELASRAESGREQFEEVYGAGSPLAAARLRREVAGWDLTAVNMLITEHNRYYPIERRLPMDPLTGDYVAVNGRSYRRPNIDHRTVVAWGGYVSPADATASGEGCSSARRAAAAPASPATAQPTA
jgi:hypothetical protein